MVELRFKYVRDKLCKRLSVFYIVIIVLLFVSVFLFTDDGYMRAWLCSILAAIAALYILSIPRYISIDGEKLEIHCVVEMTRIQIQDIANIREIDKKAYRWIPALGSYGFFGYYGYYLDLRRWDMIKVYAGKRANLLEITDIFEQVYIVSCRDADTLIEIWKRVKNGDQAT